MMIDDRVMNEQERISFRLRSLYSEYGYERYRMSKFEEYDLYSRNKDFLFSENVITFTDTNGRLMALKPDVTLSIVKTGKTHPDSCRNCTIMRMFTGFPPRRTDSGNRRRSAWNAWVKLTAPASRKC